MRTLALVGLVLGALIPPAAADLTHVGRGCTTSDFGYPVDIDPGYRSGQISSWPVVAVDYPGPVDETWTITLVCGIQLGGTGAYSDPDVASASATGTTVVAIPPTPFRYADVPGAESYYCATRIFTSSGGDTVTLYYDDVSDSWIEDEDAARCVAPEPVN